MRILKRGYDLVNLLIPNAGMAITVRDYINSLLSMGYNIYQARGSIGGCSLHKTIELRLVGEESYIIRL